MNATDKLHLIDGSPITYRAIRPGDQRALQRFHAKHSEQSIHQRFFGAVPKLGDEQAHAFTNVDGVNRVALVALDPDRKSEIIGVARYDRYDLSATAEYACIVADAWHGKGVGTALTRALIARALVNDIDVLEAIVLPDNRAMLDLLAHLGLAECIVWEDDVARVKLQLR